MTNEGPGDRGVGSRGGVVGSRGGQRGGGSGDGASTAIQYAQTLKEQTPCRPTAQIYFFCHQSLQLPVQLSPGRKCVAEKLKKKKKTD